MSLGTRGSLRQNGNHHSGRTSGPHCPTQAGIPKSAIQRYLRELAVLRHDRKELIRGAKQRIKDMENLMLREQEDIAKDKDLGWDATSLIDEYGQIKPKD